MRLSFGAPDLRAIDFRFWDHRFSERLVPESGATSFIGFQKLGCKPLIRFRHPSRSDPSLPIEVRVHTAYRSRSSSGLVLGSRHLYGHRASTIGRWANPSLYTGRGFELHSTRLLYSWIQLSAAKVLNHYGTVRHGSPLLSSLL
ncbi:hypothetical protein U1Q18_041996, partial [Sarracenia purpurea var. burkii]